MRARVRACARACVRVCVRVRTHVRTPTHTHSLSLALVVVVVLVHRTAIVCLVQAEAPAEDGAVVAVEAGLGAASLLIRAARVTHARTRAHAHARTRARSRTPWCPTHARPEAAPPKPARRGAAAGPPAARLGVRLLAGCAC